MVCTFNKAPPVAYFKQAEYYSSPALEGRWYAPDGAFGIIDDAPIDFDLLDRLYAAVDERGASLLTNKGGRIIDRQPAFDLTLSAPKSFSLRYAMANDAEREILLQAFIEAVRSTLGFADRIAAWARRGKGGATLEEVSFSAAVFVHDDARPAEHEDGTVFSDVDLHAHCLVLNLAKRADGTVGAIDSLLLRSSKMVIGAVFHAYLAARVAKLHLSVDRLGHNGTFEIAGISARIIQFFSARRANIKKELREQGTTSSEAPALAAAVTKQTRLAKMDSDPQARRATWHQAAERNGIDFHAERMAAAAAFQPLTEQEAETLYQARLAELLRILTEGEAVLDHREVIRQLNAALVGTTLSPERAKQAMKELLERRAIVIVGKDPRGFPLLSTPDMIETEVSVVSLATELHSGSGFELDEGEISRACAQFNLSAEQARAAHAVTRAGQVNIVEGAPGSGKSTSLRPIVAGYKAAGFKVIGAATAWKIALGLGADLDIPSQATAAWQAAIERGEAVLDSKTVLIVDEAGLLSAREMRGLLEAVKAAGAKVILVGDRNQLQPIGAGSGLDLVARVATTNRIETIVRQHFAWLKAIVRSIGEGETLRALKSMARRGNLRFEPDTNTAVAALVERWRALNERGVGPLVLARTNLQLQKIAEAIRQDRRAHGELGEEEIKFTSRLPNGTTAPVCLSVGDPVRFLAKNRELGVVNGSVGHVVGLEPGTMPGQARLRVDTGDRIVSFPLSDLADEDGNIRLGWNYASTTFASQGLTVDEALILADANLDRHLSYVAMSRARSRTTMFVDASSVDAVEVDLSSHPALDLEAERLLKLASRMKRKRRKQSTLDYLPRREWAKWLRPGAEPPRPAPEPILARVMDAEFTP